MKYIVILSLLYAVLYATLHSLTGPMVTASNLEAVNRLPNLSLLPNKEDPFKVYMREYQI